MTVQITPTDTPPAPLRETPLPFYRPQLTEAECAAVLRTLQSGWLTTGQECAAFEAELGEYLGVERVAALNSCTAGLHLGLIAAGVGPGDQVITTPFTFCASVNVIEHVGATPVFVDVDPATGCLDAARLPDLAAKCIIPVHYAGIACDLATINAWAAEQGTVVLSDCAHAIETRDGGRSLAEQSDLAAYSFYATKNLTTGEGGALTCQRSDWFDRIRELRLHGMSKDALRRYEPGASPLYDVAEPGFKYNLTDPAAALGRLQLEALDTNWIRRAELVGLYFEGLSGMLGAEAARILVPHPSTQTPENRCGYHLLPLIMDPEAWTIDRNTLVAELQRLGIGTSVHFTPVHRLSYYASKYALAPEDYPHATFLGANEISLPLHPWLSEADIADVCAALTNCQTRFRR